DGGTVVLDGGHASADSPSTVLSAGTIEARGATPGSVGGEVHILGDHVGLVEHASVDVRGDQGGGTALIGGDYHGRNPLVQNAERTFVGSDSKINADAVTDGDGGRVIVWSDNLTRFYGDISAQGGARHGNGGFAEISSGLSLVAPGHVDLSAAHGT